MTETVNPRFYLYKPKEINISEALNIPVFKSKLSTEEHDFSKNDFKKILGEPHPFDYTVIEGLEQKFGLVGAVEDKICDYALGPGIFIESEHEKLVELLEKWITKAHLLFFARPWLKNGLGKGTGYLEIAGLTDIEKTEKIKVVDSNTVYVKRDDYGKIEKYNQYLGSTEGRIDEEQINELTLGNIIQLNINQVGNNAYGMGLVFAGIPIINDFINAQSAQHKILRRKANSQIHAKLGNVEKEDYPEQTDIDAFGSKLQYMNESTEWVTGPNVEMNVLDFGSVGDKFDSALQNDLKLLSYTFQVPESILGAEQGYVGAAKIHESGFEKNIKSYQQQLGFILRTKVFDVLLEQAGMAELEYNVVWGQQDEEDKNKIRESLQKILAVMSLSPGMKIEYEKKLAILDDIDYDKVNSENQKVMRRDNRDKKRDFGQQVQLQQVKKTTIGQKEHLIDHTIEDNMLLGKAPQEIEAELISKYKLSEKDAQEKVIEIIEEFENDYSLEEWIGEFIHVKKEILEGIQGDAFENIAAIKKGDVALGKLNKKQVEQIRQTFADGFENNRGLKEIAKNINKNITLKDRYIMKNDKKVLAISKEKRAYLMARSETVRLRANGTLISAGNKNIKEVEFTLVSAKACPICEALDGDNYSVKEAFGVIPVHANCRCKWTEV